MEEGVEVITLFNYLPEMPAEIQKSVGRLIRKAAFDIQAQAMRNLYTGHGLDTGALKASIYTVTAYTSGYERASSGAAGKNPTSEMLPEVPKPTSKTAAIVAVGMDYGVYGEFGTVKMAAFPYLTPAVELVRPQLIAALRAVEGWLGLPGAAELTPEPADPGEV